MGPRSFNRGNVEEDWTDPAVWRFNGAAVIQPRKLKTVPVSRCPYGGFNGAAVIQPRKRLESTSIVRSFVSSFNGAAVIQPRKRDCELLPLHSILQASMGPRSFNRGNAPKVGKRGL